jgi:nitrous oxidase accessory protein
MNWKAKRFLIYSFVTILIFQGLNQAGAISTEQNNVFGNNKTTIIVPDDYSTIQSAVDNSGSEATIFLKANVYHENIIINGANHNGLTIIGEHKEQTIITADETPNTDTIVISNVSGVTIKNITITGSGQEFNVSIARYKNFGVKVYNANNILMQSNIIKENGNGVICQYGSIITILNNTIIDNMDDGIEGNGQFFIYSNNISNNGHGLPSDITNGDGIEIMASAKASEIINNIISYNGVDGIWDETVDDHLITDNIIHHNGQSGIHLEEGRDCKIRNNIIYGNGYGEFGKSGAGIILYQSTSNIIDNNDVYDNNRGIYLQQSHYNEISDNEIYGNEKAGIDLHQTSGTQIFNNNIKENFVGLLLMFANNFQILYNDIYLNSLFGLVSVLSVGAATLNWWGHMFGPYMVQILRIPPLITMVTPWSINRNNA